MVINGVELQDVDIFDLETAEKCDKAFDEVKKKANIKEGTGLTEIIRIQCNAVFECFNEIFGEGTDKKVFGNKTNLRVCLKAFEELVEYANEQKKEMDNMYSKYSPNRASRRSKKQ